MSDWWLYAAYLDCRLPLPINVSPGIRFPERRFLNRQDWLWYAASLLSGIVEFYQLLAADKVGVDKLAGQPLCMSQYYGILCACRVPGFVHDSVIHNRSSSHVVVAHKGNFYRVDVIDDQKKALSTRDLFHQLETVVDTSSDDSETQLGILTTLDRDRWASAYRRMLSSSSNRASFQQIQQSLMLLALDGPIRRSYGKHQQQSSLSGALNALHGGGTEANSANRWFDKTLQLIVSEDGTSGLNYEHAPAEGPPIIRLVDHVFQRLAALKETRDTEAKVTSAKAPQLLKWFVDSDTELDLRYARQQHNKAVRDLQCQILVFSEFGKNVPKTHKMSPDAFIQVALQLTFRKLHGHDTASYESGSLRKFYLGRTDTIRGCSPESAAFCTAVLNNDPLDVQTRLFREATTAHRSFTDKVISGHGFDRHLLGLRLIARDNQLETPEWAHSSSYQRALHFRLSTSQVPALSPVLLLFGPVVADGYGICYNPQENAIHIAATSYRSCVDTDARRFVDELAATFRYLRHLLEAKDSLRPRL